MNETNFKKANKLLLNNKLEEAIVYYKKAIEENQQFHMIYENIALAYKKLERFDEADFYIRKALSSNPNLIRSNYELKNISKQNLRKKQKTLLSIIVPVYNTEKYLKKCISSILNQTLKELELIIIDDGSSDNSLDIIKEFMCNDSRIVLIENEKASGNPGTPRNQAIKIANGYYLGFVDSDDWIDENMYKTLVDSAMKNNNDMVFSGGFKNHIDTQVDNRIYNNDFFNEKDSKYFKFHDSFMIWDKIYRTDLIKNFNIELAETKAAVDVPFIFKAYYYLHNVGFCNSLLSYNYRRESETSVTVNFRKKSDCKFELNAYHNIEKWADDENINNNYINLIKIKKISSYIYTLKVISTEMFNQFYNLAQKELLLIDREIIENFVVKVKKRHILKTYDDICSLNANEYIKKHREKDVDVKKEIIDATFKLEGENNGILFFPEWTYSNPYQKLMYTELNAKYGINTKGYKPEFFTRKVLEQNRIKHDYIHLHWLHVFMDTSIDSGVDKFLDTIQYAKSIGYKFIYTAHNIISHESLFYERELKFRKQITKEFDYLLVHGKYAKERLVGEIGVNSDKVYIIEHGVYENSYLNLMSREESRKILSISKNDYVFLFLGNIRGYKGIEPLIKSFNNISKYTKNIKLVIAGNVIDEDSSQVLESAILKNKHIIYKPGFIKNDDIQIYFNASDIMVLPYKKILTSGAALLSITFNKPVIAPNTGLIPELISSKQGYLFNSYDEMTSIMRSCIDNFNSGKWDSIVANLEFSELNNKLRWSKILAKKPFSTIFKKDLG